MAASQPPAERATPARRSGALPQLGYLLKAMRPRQWPKAGLVFLALIFSVGQEYHVNDPDSWIPLLLKSLVAFVSFCMVSSADYLVNDISDI